MKVTLNKDISQPVEFDVEFPFFRKDSNVYYAIYSLEHGIEINHNEFHNTYKVYTMNKFDIAYEIRNDEWNLEITREKISENEFNEIKEYFLDRL